MDKRKSAEPPVKSVSPDFEPLVQILRSLKSEGQTQPLRSQVGLLLLKNDPTLYKRTGHARFAVYVANAETSGIVELGGKDGKAWIELHPSFQQDLGG